MSIVVTQRPEQTVSGDVSRWNAVGNPIVYKLQRKDFVFNQINNSGGLVQMQFNGVDYTGSFNVGDYVYVQSDNGVYAAAGTVTAESFSTNTLITVDIAYTSAATGGFVNNDTLRPSYRVYVNLYSSASVLLNSEPFIFSTPSTGLLTLNVSGIIRPLLTPDNTVTISAFGAFEDANIYEPFKVGYTELWTGSTNSETIDSTVIYSVLGALQIPSTYGGNMYSYVSWDDGSPVAQFLTKLDTPVMWRGWPFVLDAIVSEFITGNVYVDAGSNTSTPAAFSGKVISAVLTGVTDSANDTFTVSVKRSTGPTQIVATKTIEVRDACQNPVLLMGRNLLGGPVMWMFDFSQEYTFDYGDGRKAKRLTLYTDNLTINQWESIQEFISLGEVYQNNIIEFDSTTIKTSTRIGQQIYSVNQDGSKVGVIVIPTINTTLTRRRKHRFEIDIEFPETFVP